jgi:hypothetical protein
MLNFFSIFPYGTKTNRKQAKKRLETSFDLPTSDEGWAEIDLNSVDHDICTTSEGSFVRSHQHSNKSKVWDSQVDEERDQIEGEFVLP